jgi:hypothetical protein
MKKSRFSEDQITIALRDNVFVEGLWRSVKYARVCLKAYDSVSAARADIAEYLDWYNVRRSQMWPTRVRQ